MENTENGFKEAQVKEEITESGIYSEGEELSEKETEAEPDELVSQIDEDAVQKEWQEKDALSELCRLSGKAYESIDDFPEHERFLQLLSSGVLTPEEAFYAVNRGKKPDLAVEGGEVNNDTRVGYGGSKRHMTASVRKPSSGEVFTRADREELAKWGITATGSELERLWRNAGSCATRK